MKLENQVCTLEQAKRLHELGIDQTSIFYWQGLNIMDGCASKRIQYYPDAAPNNGLFEQNIMCNYVVNSQYSAFTVAELGAMLGRFARNTSSLSDDGNEAIDRADDLIHLLEIEELLVDGCNERLNES